MNEMKGFGPLGHDSHIVGLTYRLIAHRVSGVPGFSPPSIAINMQ